MNGNGGTMSNSVRQNLRCARHYAQKNCRCLSRKLSMGKPSGPQRYLPMKTSTRQSSPTDSGMDGYYAERSDTFDNSKRRILSIFVIQSLIASWSFRSSTSVFFVRRCFDLSEKSFVSAASLDGCRLFICCSFPVKLTNGLILATGSLVGPI